MAERAVVLELVDIVHEEAIRGRDRLGGEVEVEVDRKAEPARAEPPGLDWRLGVLDDGPCADDDVRAFDCPRRVRRKLDSPLEFGHALRVWVEGADPNLWVQRREDASVIAALLSAAEDRGLLPALRRPPADADTARRRGARRSDLGAVHDGRR
jgi:hypothetical protein